MNQTTALRALPPLGAVLLLCAPLAAQAAGSETHSSLAQGLGAGGESSNGVGTEVAASIAQPLTGPEATSANFRMRASVAWVTPEIVTSEPIVFGVRAPGGAAVGGDAVELFGTNFLAPGAGALDVAFGGAAAGQASISTNTRAAITTPPGMNLFGNPLAEVDVTPSNLLGSTTTANGFLYTPALVHESPSAVGGRLEMRLQMQPNDVYFLAMGKAIPGFAVPLAPWDGALEIVLNLQVLQSGIPAPHGTSLFQLDVPDDPNLVGGTLQFQAFVVRDFLTPLGGFSNRLDVTFLP